MACDKLLLETGDALLTEDGGFFLLESGDATCGGASVTSATLLAIQPMRSALIRLPLPTPINMATRINLMLAARRITPLPLYGLEKLGAAPHTIDSLLMAATAEEGADDAVAVSEIARPRAL
jgi:hypothetical protein